MQKEGKKNSNKNNAKADAVKASSKGKLGSLLGHTVISVMRACGKHGWTYEELQAAMAAQVGKEGGLTVMPKEHTMRLALKRGRDCAAGKDYGERKIADLSSKALDVLRATPKVKKHKKKVKTEVQEAQVEESAPETHEEAAEVTEAAA